MCVSSWCNITNAVPEYCACRDGGLQALFAGSLAAAGPVGE